MKNPKVFIIILNYNGADVLPACLDSVYKLNYPNKEVVVVDNNSSDNSFEEARKKFRNFHFIKNSHNAGFASGNNVAIKWALEKMADYIFLLNNDTIIKGDALIKMVNIMERSTELGIISPTIYQEKSKRIWFAGGKINWLKMRTEHKKNKNNCEIIDKNKTLLLNTDYITGCAMLIRKNVFSEIGLFDEKFFLYYEDADFSYRAKQEGFNLGVASQATVFHFEKSTKNPNKIYWLVLSGILFFKKNSPWFYKPWIIFYLFLRKLKNTYIVRKEKTEISLKIKKAFQDSRYKFSKNKR